MHIVRVELSQLHEFLHLGNHILSRRRHHRIKIPCRLPINQIPPPVALPSLHKRKIPAYPALQHILPPIKLPRLFPLRHHRPETRRRVKPRNPRPARSNPLRKRPLRIQLQLQLPTTSPSCSNSLFSPTYVETIFFTCRFCNNNPIPKSSTPALLLTIVRSLVPLRLTAAIKFSGIPQSPNPPIRMVAPSLSPSIPTSADPILLSTLSPPFDRLAPAIHT